MAIDGKTIRRSFDHGRHQSPLHVVSAWASEQGLVLGQRGFRRGAPSRAGCDAFDDTHGRLVRRRVFASTDAAALNALSGWPGLRTVLAVESIRSVNSAPKVESEIRYFLSNCPDGPAVLGQAIRSHLSPDIGSAECSGGARRCA